jgi:hypothetical protein
MKNLTMAIMAMATYYFALSAHAQQTAAPSAGVLAPPPEVSNIVSIDAHNSVLVETQNPQALDEPKQYALALPRHIYSGGVARVLGGSIISTEMLVIPQSALRAFNGVPGGFGGFNGFRGNAFGGNAFNGTSNFTPRIPVNNLNQFNRVLGALDQPPRQAQVGVNN